MPDFSMIGKLVNLIPYLEPSPGWDQWSVVPDIMFWEILFQKNASRMAIELTENGSEGPGTCCQISGPEFKAHDSHGRRRE